MGSSVDRLAGLTGRWREPARWYHRGVVSMDFEVTVLQVKICIVLVAASSTLVAFGAAAHHSVAYYGDEYTEVRGVIVDVDWINPHVRLTVEAENGAETWRMEGSSVYPLRGAGVTADQVPVGTRVTAIGKPSTREDFMMLVETIRLENGRELPFWDLVGRVPRELRVVDAAAEDRGIFRVWSVPYQNIQLQLDQLGTQPFTDAAIASRASWNPLDNFATRCEPEGMPRIMVNPHPFEFIDRGNEITLRTELYDIVRTIHMDREAPPDEEPWSRLGYSVGTWEDNDLVVTTSRVNWPWFDNAGTRQSEQAVVTERFTLSEDQTRLDFEVSVVDDATFTEPAVLRGYWLALGESIAVYDCVPVDR